MDCTTGACSGRRDRAELACDDGELVGLLIVRRGQEHVEHGDERLVLRPGHALLWDSTRPLRFVVPQPLVKQTLLVPRCRLLDLLPAQGVRTDVLTAGPATRLLTDDIGCLAEAGHRLPAPAVPGAATAALELLAAALWPAERTDDRPAGWDRVRGYVEEHLADPDLTPAAIAAAQPMSLRALYLLFTSQGQTVSAYVRRRRLVRARAELVGLAGSTTVAEVAHRWGFADQSSFSRAFRRQYGSPPNDVRLGRSAEPDTPVPP